MTEVTEPAPEPEPVTEPLERSRRRSRRAPSPRAQPRRSRHRGRLRRLGEYFGVDAVLIRIAAIVLVFAGGAGLLLYAIGWIAMPEAPEPGTPEATRAAAAPARERTGGAVALGLAFVVLGAFFLADEIWSDFLAWKYIWPIALIAVGAVVLVRARR